MKATRNIADRNERSQKSLLRKVADFVNHPVMARFTHSGPGSLATGQAGAYTHGARSIEYRGSPSWAICACQEECSHDDVASSGASPGLAFSNEF